MRVLNSFSRICVTSCAGSAPYYSLLSSICGQELRSRRIGTRGEREVLERRLEEAWIKEGLRYDTQVMTVDKMMIVMS
jgi:hypothetical protein